MSACPRCARPSPADARFCSACGTPLLPARDTRFASPGAYTPPHLAARILDGSAALAGERKQVTVLFADVKSSMELFAERDPEEVARILEDAIEHMLEAVHRYEGTVTQVMGDGIMALFGAPLAREDHAVRACYAALRMQERIGAYADALQREGAQPVQIRVGLNSGEVVVGSVGSDLHMVYTAIGQTVHLAARMEQMAKPASILATGHTLALAGARVLTRPLGPVPVRGMAEPVEVHEVTGAARIRSRLESGDARSQPGFVGRAEELARLRGLLEAARGGAGRLVALVGEAGVGKSRLVREFARECRAEGCLVLETAGVSYGRAVAYSAGVEMNRRYFALDEGDTPEVVRDKVSRKLLALDPALEDGIPPMLWRLGALPAGSAFLGLDPAVQSRRADDISLRVVEREARERPVVLVVEDLHWIDAGTLASLEVFCEHMPAGTLLIVSQRPEFGTRLAAASGPGATRLRLDALPSASARELLDGLLGRADPDLDGLAGLLIERTEGNPLFLEECVRSLVETGVLGGERGAHRLLRPVSAVEVPAGVRSVLAARIDRLPPEQKRLLQAAAVIGAEVPARLLEAIADEPGEDVRRVLRELRDAELLDETALFPDLEYRFTHALTHDVAYEGLLHHDRRAVHARVAEALERLGPPAPAGRAERLAHHAFLGEAWDRAVVHCRDAAARAAARLAAGEAVAWLERALAALGHLPETEARCALAVDLRHELCSALMPLGEHARMLVVLTEGESLADGLGDDRRLARTLSLRSQNLWELGRLAEALEAGERALDIAGRAGDVGLSVVACFSMGGAARALGDYPRAVDLLQRNHALLDGVLTLETFGLAGVASVLSASHLAWSLAELGEFSEAIPIAEEAVRRARAADHALSLAYAHLGLGGTLVRRGEIWEAMGVLEDGLGYCAEVPALFPPLAGDLAVVYALSGRIDRALDLAEQAVQRAERMGRLGRLSLITTHLGEVSLFAGRRAAAARHAQRALDLAVAHSERGNQVYALRLQAVLAAEERPADVERARETFVRALDLAEQLSMRPLIARCHVGLGRLARSIGDAEAAGAHLDRARGMLEDMGMSFWLDRLALDQVGPS